LPTGTPFVVFGDDWGRHVSTIQHLFRRILRQRPVIWVNSFGHRVPEVNLRDARRAVEKVRAMLRGPRATDGDAAADTAPAQVIEPKALPWHNVRWVHAMNTTFLVRDIRRALARLPGRGRPILVTGTPAATGVVGSIGEQASIYFCMDNYAELPGVSRALIEPLEQRLLAKVGAVVGTAAEIAKSKVPASGRVFHLPQGVNFDHFATRQPMPSELAGLPRPLIGYAGGISEYVSFDVIRAVAASHPSGSVVLVGPAAVDISSLTLPNVHILGSRPYATLPAYVQAFDVGIIPYMITDCTRSIDPLKLLEYMAAGIPVVSTPIPEVFKYAALVSVAETPEAFAQGTVFAAANDTPDLRHERQAVARANTWERRATQFLDIVDQVVSESARPTTMRSPDVAVMSRTEARR
jgi:glycosyltransferase involved in cell wall biosynthesis